jgi:hypothetical protein
MSFHRFPKDENRRRMWINAVRRKDWVPSKEDRVCGRHFVTG